MRSMWPIFFSAVLFLFSPPSSSASSPTEGAFPSGGPTLNGFLYKPQRGRPLPPILYRQRPEPRPGAKPEIGNFFASKGYVLFVPHRRGHGRSPADRQVDALFDQGLRGIIALHEIHLEDILAALAYLRSLSD